MSHLIHIAQGNELSPLQENFINTWSKEYFDHVAVSRDLKKASVHWRLFLTVDGELVSHVALTEFLIVLDGESRVSGAVGGLLTARPQMGKGFGNYLIEAAEAFIFDKLKLDSGLLFCLPHLVSFYERRDWINVLSPVTLEQPRGVVTWPEAVMILKGSSAGTSGSIIHVPLQPPGGRGGLKSGPAA